MATKADSSQAFAFPEVRVVEASAGSGKTYALAKRYIQLLLQSDIKVYPNPTEGQITIELNNISSSEIKSIQLFNTTGKLIDTQLRKVGNNYVLNFDANTGVLWLVITTDNSIYRKEIIQLN